MSRGIRGFTLIELLVVVAIIVLLIAILLPSLGKAREQGRAVQCSSNMRSIGQLVTVFAAAHQERGPGEGTLAFDPTADDAPVAWDDILNYDTMDVNTDFGGDGIGNNMPDPSKGLFNHAATLYGGREVQTVAAYDGFVKGKHFLVCPDFEPTLDWGSVYAYNRDAAGGNCYTAPGIYGMKVDPRTACRNPNFFAADAVAPGGCGYSLGANLKRFTNSQIMLAETQYTTWFPKWQPSATPDAQFCRNLKGGVVAMNDDSRYPNFCAHAGELAFRHPFGKRGAFMFFDIHVEMMTPKDNIDADSRWFIDGVSHSE